MERELTPEESKRAEAPAPEPTPAPEPIRQDFTPGVGAKVTVVLRGESTRATVEDVLEPDVLVVVLNIMEPMAKTHDFKFNDRVVVVRRRGLGGLPYWEAQQKA